MVEVCEHPGALRALTEQRYVSNRSQLSPVATFDPGLMCPLRNARLLR